MRAYTEQTAPSCRPSNYTVLGTDGFGRSDTRANLRCFFEVDRSHRPAIAVVAKDGKVSNKDMARVIKQYRIDVDKVDPDWA